MWDIINITGVFSLVSLEMSHLSANVTSHKKSKYIGALSSGHFLLFFDAIITEVFSEHFVMENVQGICQNNGEIMGTDMVEQIAMAPVHWEV